MATVRLTVALDISEATLEKAIAGLMEWPTSNAGPDNMVYAITRGGDNGDQRRTTGDAFLQAIVKLRPEVVKDYARLQELDGFWHKHQLYLINPRDTKKLCAEELTLAREYVQLQVKYKSKDQKGWKERLKELNEMLHITPT